MKKQLSKSVPAYSRRNRALLEWIRAEKTDAEVFWGSEKVGSWEDIQARWEEYNGKIRLTCRMRDRYVSALITSLESTASYLTIFLKHPRNLVPDRLRVVWGQGTLAPPPQGHSLAELARHWIRQRWPGSLIVSASQRADRAHTLSGSYLRVQVRQHGRVYLVLACDPAASIEITSGILTQGLLWLTYLRSSGRVKEVVAICLMVPEGSSGIVYHRAQFLNARRTQVEIWDYQESGDKWAVRRAPPAPPPEEHRDFHWPVLGPFRWSPLLARVLDLAPHSIRRYPRFQDYDSLRLCGLEFARVMGEQRDRLTFGVGGEQTELTEDNFEVLSSLVQEILFFRRPDSPDTHHLYYRLQPERWLESLILEDVARLFPELSPEAVYSQIPVYLGKDPGRVDILGADRTGTLVVMELKVSEDPNLPLQALDYWGRVIQHNLCGDFRRRGYFSELQLNRRQPRIYLVSPVFSFHDSTERLLGCLDPDLEVWKIAINHGWRAGVKILQHTRLRCGEIP